MVTLIATMVIPKRPLTKLFSGLTIFYLKGTVIIFIYIVTQQN